MKGSDIFSLANKGLKLAESCSSDVKSAEIFFGRYDYINIEIEENSIKNSEIGSDAGVSIRVIDKSGSLGFAFTNSLNNKAIEQMIKNSIKMMNAGTPDPDFKVLPASFSKYPSINDLFDPNLRSIEIEDAIKYVEDLIQVCKEDELAISQSGSFTSSYYKKYIFNSNGLEANGKATVASIESNMIVKDKTSKESTFGVDYQSERLLKNIDAKRIAATALKNGKRNLNRKKIKSRKVPLILTPNGTITMILSPIASAVNADTYQYKRSFLVGKKGETIGSELLNIEDNALLDGAVGSIVFDGEGVPGKNKKIIKSGKFLNSGLLHNSYTAGKEGIESTGNASRGFYSSLPAIGTSNLIMKPGNISKDELIGDIKEGILLDYTGDSPNIATGDFSGLILQGNLIINGEIKDPLNETMFGINLLDLFKNIDAVSKEFKTYGSFQAPHVRIKDVQIIGGA